jgi:CheY-like chemotaxis protein
MVLVVEDEMLIRTMVAEILRDEGLAVVEATSADEALIVLRSPAAVSLILTDIRMPGSMDGLQLARIARAQVPGLKIVVLSSHMEGLADSAFIDAFLAKPFKLAAVVETVMVLLADAGRAV